MSSSYKDGMSFGHAEAVTPHNTNDLSGPCDSLYVGGAGAVKIDTAGGETVTISGVQAGSCINIRATRVYSTDTTATDIVRLWNPVT